MSTCEYTAAMKTYFIPNLGKACQVINLVSNNANGCPLKEISRQLAIPRTTALRITQTLLQSDYLVQKDDKSFVLGSAIVQLGVKALDSFDIRGYARPILQALSADTDETSHLAVLTGTKSMLIEVCDSPHPIRIAARPGTLVDLHCSATGKVFLAYSVADPATFCRQLALTSHTKNTHCTVEAVLAGIEETRRNGYALDEEEYMLGARCIAAPVVNAFGKTVDALGITASVHTVTKDKVATVAAKVKKAAAELSAKLGYQLL